MRRSQNSLELQLGQLQLALVVIGVGLEIDELPLARRVIHQRRQPNAFVVVEMGEAFEAIRRRDLAAQMDEMIGAQPVIAHAVLDRVGELAHVRRGHVRILVEADAQRVEDGGDAGGRDLCVMRQHRGKRVPAHLGARRVVAFEVVGVQFDQAGNQEIAAHVLAGARRRPTRCRRSGRRGSTASPSTTSSASTMRALFRISSADISGSLSVAARLEAAP